MVPRLSRSMRTGGFEAVVVIEPSALGLQPLRTAGSRAQNSDPQNNCQYVSDGLRNSDCGANEK